MGRHFDQLLKIDIENGGDAPLPYPQAQFFDDLEELLISNFEQGVKTLNKLLKNLHPLEQLFIVRDISSSILVNSPFDHLSPGFVRSLAEIENRLLKQLKSQGLTVELIERQLTKFNLRVYERLSVSSQTIVWKKSARELASHIHSLIDNGSIENNNRSEICRLFSLMFVLQDGKQIPAKTLYDYISFFNNESTVTKSKI